MLFPGEMGPINKTYAALENNKSNTEKIKNSYLKEYSSQVSIGDAIEKAVEVSGSAKWEGSVCELNVKGLTLDNKIVPVKFAIIFDYNEKTGIVEIISVADYSSGQIISDSKRIDRIMKTVYLGIPK